MRRFLAFALILGALLGFVPMLQQVMAYVRAHVDTPSAGGSRYALVSSDAFVQCSVSSLITLQRNSTGGAIRCVNRYNASVSVTISVEDTANLVVQNSNVASLSLPANSSACYAIALRALALDQKDLPLTDQIILAAKTVADASFYAELYFPAQVRVQQQGAGVGGGCP